MFTIIVVVVLLLGAAAWEGRLLARKKQWGELIVATAIWLFATAYAAVVISPVTLINPNKVIIALLDLLYSRF